MAMIQQKHSNEKYFCDDHMNTCVNKKCKINQMINIDNSFSY